MPGSRLGRPHAYHCLTESKYYQITEWYSKHWLQVKKSPSGSGLILRWFTNRFLRKVSCNRCIGSPTSAPSVYFIASGHSNDSNMPHRRHCTDWSIMAPMCTPLNTQFLGPHDWLHESGPKQQSQLVQLFLQGSLVPKTQIGYATLSVATDHIYAMHEMWPKMIIQDNKNKTMI